MGKTKVTCLVVKKRDSLVVNTVTQLETNLKEPLQQQSKIGRFESSQYQKKVSL